MSVAIFLSGSPTSGKETQGLILKEEIDADYLITSNALEQDGHRQKMKNGDLVSDDMVFQSIEKRINSKRHTILDGATRTHQQATLFPGKLRENGFDLVIAIELNLTDVEIALDRRKERLDSGGSNNRPDGDKRETFLKRFQRHNEEADAIRRILIRTCDEFFIIDALKSKNCIAKRIKEIVKMVLKDEYPEEYVDYGGFLGQSEHMIGMSSR